jgi:hypothetical protein
VSKFGFDQVHEYVLKLIDAQKCPEMDENCPEPDKLDITKCLSGMFIFYRNFVLREECR